MTIKFFIIKIWQFNSNFACFFKINFNTDKPIKRKSSGRAKKQRNDALSGLPRLECITRNNTLTITYTNNQSKHTKQTRKPTKNTPNQANRDDLVNSSLRPMRTHLILKFQSKRADKRPFTKCRICPFCDYSTACGIVLDADHCSLHWDELRTESGQMIFY